MKVLFEGLSPNIGGIETATYSICKYLIKDGHEVSFLVDSNLQIAYQDEYEKHGCKIFRVENRKKSYTKYLNDLKEVYSENNFDIIHINVMSYSLFERILYAYKYSKAKVVVHSHFTGYSSGYYRTRFLHQVGKLILDKNKFYKIACGKAAGDYMFENSEYTIINNGIDIDRFKFSEEKRDEIRHEFGIEDDTKVILDVSRFAPVKNHEFLIDIFTEYLKLNENSKLILIGEGEEKESILQKVKELNIENRVIFAGQRTDTNKIYSAADVYVIPSKDEGLNISVCEAQINGLKCFMSTNVDTRSNITGNVKFLSLEETPKKWAEEIFKCDKRDKDILEKIPDEYKLDNTNLKLYEFYNKILKEG